MAPTAVSLTSTYRSTSTSTPSARTAAAPQWPPSRPSSASAPNSSPAPTSRSPDTPPNTKRNQPDTHQLASSRRPSRSGRREPEPVGSLPDGHLLPPPLARDRRLLLLLRAPDLS